MTPERIFNNHAQINLNEIFHSIISEQIDSVIKEHYYNNMVNSTDSSKEEEVA